MCRVATVLQPDSLDELVRRYDPDVVDLGRREPRVRLVVSGAGEWDAVLSPEDAKLEAANGSNPDAVLSADASTWRAIAGDLRGGMDAYRLGRLTVRRDLHLGVAFLAATSGMTEPGRLVFRDVKTRNGHISTLQAGQGDPVIAIHGLGATKASFLPTVAALADDFRVIAMDQPGFGDSGKPLRAAYDAPFFAGAVIDLLDALEIDSAHLVGNSLGGRVAMEVGLSHRDRARRLGLLAPSMAWRRSKPWAPFLRLVPPKLGAIQPAPRRVVEAIVDRVIPGGSDGWAAAGVDEFLRSYLTPRGRAAFYTAARQIYLEDQTFWERLPSLEPPALFVWGRQDTLVPIGFQRHVKEALPSARHLELSCGHVPQLEAPLKTHGALARFFREG